MTGTNCLGRLSPVIVRGIDCKRVPSPPARIMAHRSVRREFALATFRLTRFLENGCWGDFALMIIGFLSKDSLNNHESELVGIPYKKSRRQARNICRFGTLFEEWLREKGFGVFSRSK